MFDRIKKAFSREAEPAEPTEGPSSRLAGPVSEWAATQGFGFSLDSTGQGMALEGKVAGKPWRMQLGRPSRNYILGQEVRARAELGVDEQVAVLVINRPLKEALEKRAYQIYTDQLQTSADAVLPEEMRWLAMYDEVGWDSLPADFWARVSVLTDRRDHAQTWVDRTMGDLILNWPDPSPSAEVPFILLLLNGKVYLRMEYTPADLATLQHAAQIFTNACAAALEAFRQR
ncbi:hypothetical protein GCM10027034_03580 [Ramlibacter solisilvae]|uniref:Uncharacterized protein n=1 Tax=Ramlibacter tataouinensis TaxID=94132 RepID=A0A127JNI0_9BURK|nr:hypothetical protein [Ramlibacter tataouinensis]AMO21564.1 hypothetical protein UC35_00115 [Ramlibacter tataouinensis]